MHGYKLSEIKYLKVNGRTTDCLEPLTLFWTASGFEVNVKASELWVEMDVDYEDQEPWFSILIDGAMISHQMVVKGQSKVCLFRNRNPEKIKHVKFVKDSQAMHDDEKCRLQIHALYTDGIFYPLPERKYKLEFIGDSITSGEGLYGAKKEDDWTAMCFSGVNSYAAMTAERLNADMRICSQSGWGVLAGWDGCRDHVLSTGYEKICGVLTGEHNRMLGAAEDYDFSEWQPDAVVINLGTNDGSAFLREDFLHDLSEFEHAAVALLKKVRHYNPKAEIVWVYGMLGDSMALPILRAIEQYSRLSRDRKVHYVQVPATTPETVGSREHPGIQNHQKAADILSHYLRALLEGDNITNA